MTDQDFQRNKAGFETRVYGFPERYENEPNGTRIAACLLREVAGILRVATPEQRAELLRVRKAATAWFVYFKWKQEKPRPDSSSLTMDLTSKPHLTCVV